MFWCTPKTSLKIFSLLFIFGVSLLDFTTGYYLRLWFLNLLPVVMIAWGCGFRTAIPYALFAWAGTILVEARLEVQLDHLVFAIWNVLAKLVTIMIAAYVFHRLHLAINSRDAHIADLQELRTILEQNQTLLTQAQQLAALGCFEWNPESDELACSGELCHLFGVDSKVTAPNMDALIACLRPGDQDVFREMLKTAQGTGGVSDGEVGTMCVDEPEGEGRILHIRITNKSAAGAKRLVGAVQDVTDRRRLEQLREQVERMVQHDLRSPLSAIINIPRIFIERNNVSPQGAELLETVVEAGEGMLRLINLSLDIYRMERGEYILIPAPVDLVVVALKIAKQLLPMASAKSVDLQIQSGGLPAESANPVIIQGDETLCYSMLSNLLRNAVEASPQGCAVVCDIDAASPQALVRIRNQGHVPDAIRSRFFEKYVTAQKKGGSGLGTYSARLIAKALGGDVVLESAKEDEVLVTVRLPLRSVDAA